MKAGKTISRGAVTALVLLGCALLLISVASLIFKDSLVLEEPPEPEPVEQIVTPSDAEPSNWAGWQNADVSGSADLMSEPNGSTLAVLDDGTTLVVMGQSDGWYHCRWGTLVGWISDDDGIVLAGEPTLIEDSGAGEAAQMSASQLEAVNAVFKKYDALCGSVAVFKGGKLLCCSAYGSTEPDSDNPCTADTKFRVASVTKVLVAMSAMSMADQGVISLDDDIDLYLRQSVRNPWHRDDPISFRMLLTHCSSLNNFGVWGCGEDLLYARVSSRKSWYMLTPGDPESWNYSNAGFGLCGAALERAYGMTLVDYAGRYFFEPLEADASLNASRIKNSELIAPCYECRDLTRSVAGMLTTDYSETPGANFNYSGTLTISAPDLAKLGCILANDGYYDGVYYMSPETVAEMETVQIDMEGFDQCIGIRYCEQLFDGRNVYYHPGLSYGVVSLLSYDPATGDGVVVIANGSGGQGKNDAGVVDICAEIAEYCYSSILRGATEAEI